MPSASSRHHPNVPKGNHSIQCRRVLLAVLSGLLLTAAFPPGGLWFVAWIALVPLFISIENQSLSRAFWYGLIAGFAHYLTLLYWVVVAMGHYGGLPIIVAIIPLVLLCLYLSLYPALFSVMMGRFHDFRFSILSAAAFWVGLEYLRAKLLSGFPWSLLGHTQYRLTPLIQITDICGVYGLSFLILLVNGLLYRILLCRPLSRKQVSWELAVTMILVGTSLLYGRHHLLQPASNPPASTPITAAIVQGNIDQSLKWDLNHQEHTLTIYENLTLSVQGPDPDVIVWPETAVPFFFQENRVFASRVLSLARASDAALIFGSPAREKQEGKTAYRNRAYLIPPGNRPPQHYDKVHLVPFGEYVPLERVLFFVDRLVPAAGDFSPGPGSDPLHAAGLSMGILICFEAIFPELARESARKGANLLINITNDAWFGITSAPYQHLSMTVFRAVENKIPLIRSANTGFSAFISPYGEIIERSELFEREVLTSVVRIPKPQLTIYARVGDLFAISCLIAWVGRGIAFTWQMRKMEAVSMGGRTGKAAS